VGLGALIAGGCAVTCRPAWYAPQAVDYVRLPEDKRALVSTVDRISAELQGTAPVTVQVDDEQVNRWIAARHELSPEEWLDAKLPDLNGLPPPHVSFLAGDRVRIAVLTERGGFGTVVSAVIRVHVLGDEVAIELDAVRLGRLPVPRSWVTEALQGWERGSIREALAPDGTWRVPNDFVWPNGRRRFRLAAVRTSDNRLMLELDPLGRGP
jgi:hypothetical protein